jgi:hypothetical protein
MPGRIAKIKLQDGRVHIKCIETPNPDVEKEIIHKSAERPHEDFEQAFVALIAHAREILEWPPSYAEGRIRITGASFSESEDGVEGAVITGRVELEEADAPFVFNTPHLPFDQYSETGCSKLMPTQAQAALGTLRVEAELFMRGKRAQGDLFNEAPEPNGKMAAAEQGAL